MVLLYNFTIDNKINLFGFLHYDLIQRLNKLLIHYIFFK